MKNYKVGDTIYIKETVTAVDKYDSSRKTYRGEHGNWLDNKSIIDELPVAEPFKPTLPKFVASLVDDHKDGFGTLGSLIGSVYYPKNSVEKLVNSWIYQDNRLNVRYKMLVDAYFNGYTVEKPKRYVLPMPGTDYHNIKMHGNAQYYAIKGTGNWRTDAIALGTDDAVKHGYTVTQSDIDAAPEWVKTIKPVEVTDDEQ